MLLKLTIKNFRSFNKEQTFSMLATSKREHADTLIEIQNMNRKMLILPINIIYGPNASGKTNIILACELIRDLILAGDVGQKIQTARLKLFESYQFMHDVTRTHMHPVELSITFMKNEVIYEYEISVLSILGKNIHREITAESLKANGILLFNRTRNEVKISTDKKALAFFNEKNVETIIINTNQVNKNINKEKLFLKSSFQDLIAKEVVTNIVDWFENNFIIFSEFEKATTFPIFDKKEKNKPINSWMKKIIDMADIGPQKFSYKRFENDEEDPSLYSKYKSNIENGYGFEIPSSAIESKGTIKLTDIMFPIVKCLHDGGTIFVDELDASIHPNILSSIISMFSDTDMNKHGAQLIFNTHNPIYMNKNLIRRDEITFVDKNEKFESEIYSLADYCRNDANYIKNYINGEYGAVRNVNISKAINAKEL